MKKIAILSALLMGGIASFAQTSVSNYTPGISAEGVVYYLPKTVINVNVTVEKTTYTPGELCQYAERYLRISNISDKEDVQYAIKEVTITPSAIANTEKPYHIRFATNSVAPLVQLDESGILLAINTEQAIPATDEQDPATDAKVLNPRSYMTEEMLITGSKAKMAELVAKEIYNIRESKSLMLRGQNDNMPTDGEALRIILDAINEQEQALMQLFTGTTVTELTTQTFQVIPESDTNRLRLPDRPSAPGTILAQAGRVAQGRSGRRSPIHRHQGQAGGCCHTRHGGHCKQEEATEVQDKARRNGIQPTGQGNH
jgi:hypothetical protein